MLRKTALFLSVLFLLSVLAFPVSAHHEQEVLGDSTSTSTPTLPATSDGPGLILPDSPFYFLDTLKQNIKLFLAFTPEQKAQVHDQIAGERLAEVRFELAKNNIPAAQIALEGLADHIQKSSENLAQAQLLGRDVTKLAQQINEDIKSKRTALSVLQDTSTGELHARVGVIQASLLESKVKVEDSLPPDQLDQEVQYDLQSEIESNVSDASHSAQGLEHAIDILEKNASEAAAKNQTQREEALNHAIAVKNDALKKQLEQELEVEQKKEAAEMQNLEKARVVVKQTQDAAQLFQTITPAGNDDTNEDQATTPRPSPSPTPGTSSSSPENNGNSDH